MTNATEKLTERNGIFRERTFFAKKHVLNYKINRLKYETSSRKILSYKTKLSNTFEKEKNHKN